MNILFLCSRFPYPPDRGDRLRLFNIMKELSFSNHRLFLISFIARKEELNYIDHMKGYCEEIMVEHLPPHKSEMKAALGLFSEWPLQVAYYQSKNMKKRIDTFLNQKPVDLIYVHLFRMASYVQQRENPYRLVDLTDVISSEIERSLEYRAGLNKWIYSLELARIREYERRISAEFDECWVISQNDADILKKLSPRSSIAVIPNGVDMSFFRPLDNNTKKKIVIFVGHLRVAHNVDAVLYFYHNIFPLVTREHPETKFYVVGADPHSKIKRLSEDPRVVVTGYVPNLNDYLNMARVFVAPLRFSTGIQNKILEAMAAGLPVVCSSLANEGLKATVGEEIMVADDPSDFANLVSELVGCPEKAEFLATKGRAFVQKNTSWKLAVDRIGEIEKGLLGTQRINQEHRGGSL